MPRKAQPPAAHGHAYLIAQLTGEIKPSDIPLATNVSADQLKALTDGDDDPLEVVVEIGPGKGGRGWNYTPQAIQKLVAHVQEQSLGGFLGHQRQEDIDHEFPTPVTHWLGAQWHEASGKAYFRGVVDKTSPDLKRWIRSGRVTAPSIFTVPTLSKGTGGETDVVDLQPLSIDWAPLGRAGMDSARVVYAGNGEMLPNTRPMAWGEMTDGEGPPPNTTPPQGGTPPVPTYAELIAGLNEGKHDHADLIRDLGISAADAVRTLPAGEIASALGSDGRRAIVVGEIKPRGEMDPVAEHTQLQAFRDGVVSRLGLGATATDEDVYSALKNEREALDAVSGSTLAATADSVIAEMKLPAPVVPLVRERLIARLPNGAALRANPSLASAESIKGVAGEIVADPTIKPLLEGFYAGSAPLPNGNGQASGEMTPLRLQTDAGFSFERRAI